MSKARLAVLLSGGGRTALNLARASADGSLDAEITVAISSHATAAGVERCRAVGIPVAIVDHTEHGNRMSARIVELLDAAGVDFVLLAGFVRFFDFPDRYDRRVLNIHPALLPSFGGKGFYGDRVHRAVLAAGVRFSGCTVHFASREYDRGPIIVQRVVPVAPDDTPESLAARVFEEECIAYPEAVRLLIAGRIEQDGDRVRIVE